jgi:hypothetical protein
MKDNHLAQLEAQLEKITEGIFARFFGKRIQVHDVALQLLRALEDALQAPQNGDSRPVAPDLFTIRVNPEVLEHILNHHPMLDEALSKQIVEITNSAAYRLKTRPRVRFVADPDFARTRIQVTAGFFTAASGTTAAMKAIKIASAHPAPNNAHLIISGERAVPLDKTIIHLGRDHSNDIVLPDMRVSRSHAQIRLRFGHYTIFDTDSAGGTYVNNVQIREHRLQAGDVIRIGQTTLVYMQDEPQQDPPTQTINPVQ